MNEGSGEEVAGVKLNAWLVGENLEGSPGAGVVNNGGGVVMGEDIMMIAQHPAVVITSGDFERLVVSINPFADSPGVGEIHRGVCHRAYFAGGDHALIGGQEIICMDLNLVVSDGRVEISAEIPVAVVDDINWCRLVGACLGTPAEFIVVVEPVGDSDIEIAGVALITIR